MANPTGSMSNENAEPSQPAAPLNPSATPLNPAATPLNPAATPFIPAALQQPATPPQPHPDSFCLFLTFSNGFHVTHQEVRDLFESMYPHQVRSVYVNIPGPNGGPEELWGKVVFTNPSIPDRLFGSFPSRTLYPRLNHPMVCKRFDSNRANNNNPRGAPPPPPPPPQ